MKINLITLINLITPPASLCKALRAGKKAPISKLGFGNYLGQLLAPRSLGEAGEIRTIRNLILFLLISLIFNLMSSPANASNFDSTYLRLNSQKPNTALSGTVCAKPSSTGAGIENKIVIAFPLGFTISSTTGNWTTSTSNLPTGSSAWPGIGTTATNVSGQNVTFSSNDLTSNILYCFNFTAISSTTGNIGNNQTGFISTQNNSNTTIDLTSYAVSIVENDQVNITASVDPSVSDLPITIESTTAGTQFPQDTTISYKITYGSNTVGPIPLTIQAGWSQGTIAGSGSPSVDILDYVVGSASDAYNSTAPVIDTVNRTITWTISSFPGATTGQTTTFKLKTNSSYTGTLPVNFDIMARAISGSTTTPDSTVSQSYLYNSGTTPTSTPTPTSAPSSGSTPTPTPTPTPAATSFTTVEIKSISQTASSIYALTTASTKMTLNYGLLLTSLNKKVSFNNFSQSNIFDLTNLQENTQYYFYISATDILGKVINSGIYTFTTASAPAAQVNENSIFVISKNNVIFDTVNAITGTTKKEGVIVIPQNTNFQFKFSFKKGQSVKKAKLIIRRKRLTKKLKVLGLNTFTNEVEAASNNVSLLEIKPGVYTATVKSSAEPGNYELLVSFIDENGNLTQQKLADIKVTNPFTVVDSNDHSKLIEGARVFLYIYNQTSRTFVPLSSNNLNIQNPSFTNHKGVDDFVLPKGKYKANITNLSYREKNVEFSIEDSDQTNYPIVGLIKDRFNMIAFLKYYSTGFNDVFVATTNAYIDSLNISIRFFDLVAASILLSFVSIALFAFSKKHHIPLSSFVSYFFYLLNHKERNKKYINGAVFDQYNKPVPLANVYLTDADNEQIIQSAKTNGKGEFFFRARRSLGEGGYSLMVMKKGYQPTPQLPYEEKNDVSYKITMEQKNLKTEISDKISHFFSSLLGISFETFILLSLIFEVLFIPSFGITKTFPFICVSVFNLILWILHRKKHYTT